MPRSSMDLERRSPKAKVTSSTVGKNLTKSTNSR